MSLIYRDLTQILSLSLFREGDASSKLQGGRLTRQIPITEDRCYIYQSYRLHGACVYKKPLCRVFIWRESRVVYVKSKLLVLLKGKYFSGCGEILVELGGCWEVWDTERSVFCLFRPLGTLWRLPGVSQTFV